VKRVGEQIDKVLAREMAVNSRNRDMFPTTKHQRTLHQDAVGNMTKAMYDSWKIGVMCEDPSNRR
jgi:hypothetical protein